jgi:hypothetical protein
MHNRICRRLGAERRRAAEHLLPEVMGSSRQSLVVDLFDRCRLDRDGMADKPPLVGLALAVHVGPCMVADVAAEEPIARGRAAVNTLA